MQAIKPDYILDAKGLCCPMPAVKTALQLEHMKQGEVVEVLTTDAVSKRDLPKWCENTGNELLDIIDSDEVLKIFIRKG